MRAGLAEEGREGQWPRRLTHLPSPVSLQTLRLVFHVAMTAGPGCATAPGAEPSRGRRRSQAPGRFAPWRTPSAVAGGGGGS